MAKTRAILDLYDSMKRQVVAMTHSQYAIHALDWIFGHPIFKTSDFVANRAIPDPTARRILAVLRQGEVLTVVSEGRGRRAAVLAFPSLLNIAEGRAAF